LITRAIPERLRGAFTTRRYTNPRLPYLYLTFDVLPNSVNFLSELVVLRFCVNDILVVVISVVRIPV